MCHSIALCACMPSVETAVGSTLHRIAQHLARARHFCCLSQPEAALCAAWGPDCGGLTSIEVRRVRDAVHVWEAMRCLEFCSSHRDLPCSNFLVESCTCGCCRGDARA